MAISSQELWIYFIFYTTVLPLFGVLLGKQRRKDSIDWFHPLTLTTVYISLVIGWRIPYITNGYSSIIQDTTVLINGLRVFTGFIVGSFVVAVTLKPYIRTRVEFKSRNSSINRVVFVAICYFIVGLFLISLLIVSFGGIDQIFNRGTTALMSEGFSGKWILVLGYQVCQVAAFSIGLLYIFTKRTSIFILACILTVISMITGLTGGFRTYFFINIIYLFIAWNLVRQRIKLRYLIMFAGVVLLVVPILNIIRFLGIDLSNIMDSLISQSTEDFNVTMLITNFSSRFINLDAQSYAFDLLASGEVPFAWGQQILETPLILIPRVLWPGKPAMPGVQMTDVFFSDFYQSGTGTTLSFPIFMLWEFGWMGFLVSPIIYGVVLAWLIQWYESFERSYANVFVYTTLLFNNSYALWSADTGMFIRIFMSVLILLPFIKFTRLRFVTSQRVGSNPSYQKPETRNS